MENLKAKPTQARLTCQRALALLKKEAKSTNSRHLHANLLKCVGVADLAQKRPHQVIESLRQALGLLEEPPVEPRVVSDIRFTLARAMLEAGKDRKQAINLAKQASETYARFAAHAIKDRSRIEDWLRKLAAGKHHQLQ